jgi:RHS repeat-associated protein
LRRVDINGLTSKSILRDGRTLWLTDGRGFVTKKELDEWDNEIRIVYPDETWVEQQYTQPWNQLVETNQLGVITAYEYDANGYMSAKIEASGTEVERRTEYTYSVTGKLLTSIVIGGPNADDAITVLTYDEYDNLTTVTDPEGRITRFVEYDAAGNPLTIEDGRGYQKHFEYDEAGNVRFVRDHNNELLGEFRYDEAGNRASSINALLKEFKFRYDTDGHLIETEDPYGNKRVTEYGSTGKVTLVEDEEHLQIRREYDSFNRLAKVIDGVGNEISYEYLGSDCSSCGSGSDLISQITYPTFIRRMEYDSRSRVVLQKDIISEPENAERITRMTYDDHGNLETITDPLGRVTTYSYDELTRRISETKAQDEVTRFVYDKSDNLIRLEDPNNGFTYFEYDLTGRLVKESKPLQEETTYTYDNNGNLVSTVNANGRKTVHTYNSLNWLNRTDSYATATDTEPAKTVTYTYNEVGSLTGYDDSVTSATYGYDDLQRRISESVNYGTFSLSHGYTYYGNSRKKSYTDPAGRIRTWSYDPAGRPTGLDLGAAGQVSTSSFAWNSPTKITLPGGSTLNYGYNGLQEPIAITAKDPGENKVIDYGYSYSAVGQVSEKTTEHGNYAYGYDDVNQLTSVESPVGAEAYTYDGLGNRLTSSEHTNWNYDDNNRLQSNGTASFDYDTHGNMVQRSAAGTITNFEYTVDNRLQRVKDEKDGAIASYSYDPFGRRLWKDVDGSRTYFHYNDEGLAGEYDASGIEERTYGYQAGSPWSTNPLFVQEGGEYYWYQNDHLGTPQKLVAQNGTVVWSATYDSFGKAVVEVATVVNNLRFPGQYFDAETGLHYNWHRFYDPDTGRYISADPIGLAGGMNLYAYVGGNPVNTVDPLGLRGLGFRPPVRIEPHPYWDPAHMEKFPDTSREISDPNFTRDHSIEGCAKWECRICEEWDECGKVCLRWGRYTTIMQTYNPNWDPSTDRNCRCVSSY